MDPMPKPKRGDILRADLLASILDRLDRLEGGKDGSGLNPLDKFIGVVGGNIPARSGTTIYGGPVTVYWLQSSSGTTGTIAESGVEIPLAWNVSGSLLTSGQSIDDGMYVGVWKDAYETWWMAPLECEVPA
jgi:hypothetical protein